MATEANCLTGQPLVSVIMNCYNGEKYLREAIDSVIAQTYQNWEIIFWDNQSTDSSAKIFNSYNDSRLKYFYAPFHTLLYEARGNALENAQGEFLAFLDVDDVWSTEKLERQIPLFENNNIGLVYSNCLFFDEGDRSEKLYVEDELPEGKVLGQLLQKYVIGLLTIVVRKSALDKLDKAFDKRYQLIGDFDLCIRMAEKWDFGCIQDPLAKYRYHLNSTMNMESWRLFKEFDTWFNEMKKYPDIYSLIVSMNIISQKYYPIGRDAYLKRNNETAVKCLRHAFIYGNFIERIKSAYMLVGLFVRSPLSLLR